MSARERILERVRSAVGQRGPTDHPGAFESWRPTTAGSAPETLTVMLERAGAEVVHQQDLRVAGAWLRAFAQDFESATVGVTLPRELRPTVATRGSHEATLGISMARAAAAETGSLLMDARDGRRTQLLPPTHVVFVRVQDIHRTVRAALQAIRDDLPSAIGLHSGPSKSADIAQTLVEGVHGPGRLVVVVIS